MMILSVFCAYFASYFIGEVVCHGYLIYPPNRASLWRMDWTQPANYNDNEYFCGGRHVQYDLNDGKCGPCGDDYRDPVPRSNENGGTFGRGIVLANYTAGSVINVESIVTANHLGSLYFHICDLKDGSQPESEECFKPLRLADGTSQHAVRHLDMFMSTKLKLPKDLVCERCVLRWHYRTGNSWGMCIDGTQNMGCGNQEIFRSCADIRIVAGDNNSTDEVPSPDDQLPAERSIEYLPNNDIDDSHANDPCIINPHYISTRQSKEYRRRF